MIAALSLALALGVQTAPASPPEPDAVAVEDVVVEGRRLQSAVSDFIAEVAAPPRGTGLATWNRTVCIGAANFRTQHATYLIDRIATIAIAVGLESGVEGCRPDVLIIGVRGADEFARALVAENGSAFRPAGSGTDPGSRALRAFQTGGRPVRWWPVSLAVSVDTGQIATRLDNAEDPPSVVVRGTSRLSTGIRQEMKRVIVIIDLDRLGDVNFAQLSDYVAMVSLAQIDPEARTDGYDSILNAFGERPPPGLTQWDLDYLKALYAAPVDRAIARHQTEAIEDEMIRARTAADRP